MAEPRTLTDALRAAIQDSGQSYYALAAATGLDADSISRFARGQTSLRLDLADRLAQYFGIESRQSANR